jgi:hypothetical protein
MHSNEHRRDGIASLSSEVLGNSTTLGSEGRAWQ